MLKRSDVDYFAKGTAAPNSVGGTIAGNDQIAFYSTVPGYYSQAGYNSNASLVAYRVNADSHSASYNRLERMGKGLALNGAYAASIPLLFLDGTTSTTIQGVWPAATSGTGTDSDCNNTGCYETVGPEAFRFEYYYLLKGASTTEQRHFHCYAVGCEDFRAQSVSGMQDVAAMVVAIAVIEPKSKALLDTVDPTGAKLERLNGADGGAPLLVDYDSGYDHSRPIGDGMADGS